jgi:glutaredoxin 2
MTETTPVLYIKERCPHCFKVLLFMQEAGLLDRVEVRRFAAGSPEEQAIRDELAPHIEKVSFPAAPLSTGRYMTESDDIIDHFAAEAGVDKAQMPLLKHYVEGPYQNLSRLRKEIAELKAMQAA